MSLLDEPAPFTALFGMASCHMNMSSMAAAHTFAKKLGVSHHIVYVNILWS